MNNRLRCRAAVPELNYQIAINSVCLLSNDINRLNTCRESDIIVDAIFGTGLNRKPSGVFKTAIERANALPACRIAVDIPSGINGDTESAEARNRIRSAQRCSVLMKR